MISMDLGSQYGALITASVCYCSLNGPSLPRWFLAAVLTDAFVVGVHHSLPVTIAAEFVLTVGYVGMAGLLRHTLKFDPRSSRIANVVTFPDFCNRRPRY